MSSDFTPEQKLYLEGLVAGLGALKRVDGAATANGKAEPRGPDAAHLAAMARTELAGKKLVEQEKWKREEHPFDAYERLKDQARTNSAPKPPDNFRWRFYGLFHVAPAQDSYMCRLRMPNGILNARQFAGVADLAERSGHAERGSLVGDARDPFFERPVLARPDSHYRFFDRHCLVRPGRSVAESAQPSGVERRCPSRPETGGLHGDCCTEHRRDDRGYVSSCFRCLR